MTASMDSGIVDFIARVVDDGSHYRIDAMDQLYTADMAMLFASGDGSIARAPRDVMFEEFAARGRNGDAPLSTEYRILHIEEQGQRATAFLYRRMSDTLAPFLYELRLEHDGTRWLVGGETVTPWPDADKAGAFLPPRQNA